MIRFSQANRHLSVFLCHSSADKPIVRDLCRKLQAAGFEPWFDEEALLPGQNWQEEIRLAVQACDVVAVCLSRSSITKDGFVQKEIRFALDVEERKPPGTVFIIPIRLEDIDVPAHLSKWQWVDLFRESGYQRLLSTLEIRARDLGIGVVGTSTTGSGGKRHILDQDVSSRKAGQSNMSNHGEGREFQVITGQRVPQRTDFSESWSSRGRLAIWTSFTALAIGVMTFWFLRPLYFNAYSVYRVRVVVLDDRKIPTNDAKVTCSIGGEVKKVEGGWECDIPYKTKPADGKMQAYATVSDAFLTGHADLELKDDFSPVATIQLSADTSAQVRGMVVDENNKPVVGARVGVVGYDAEGVVTMVGGHFSLPAHKADGQQVQLFAFKEGYLAGPPEWHQVGDHPVTMMLRRQLSSKKKKA